MSVPVLSFFFDLLSLFASDQSANILNSHTGQKAPVPAGGTNAQAPPPVQVANQQTACNERIQAPNQNSVPEVRSPSESQAVKTNNLHGPINSGPAPIVNGRNPALTNQNGGNPAPASVPRRNGQSRPSTNQHTPAVDNPAGEAQNLQGPPLGDMVSEDIAAARLSAVAQKLKPGTDTGTEKTGKVRG